MSSLGGVELLDCICFVPDSLDVPVDDDALETLLAGVIGCNSAFTIGMLSTGRVSSMFEEVMIDSSIVVLGVILLFDGGLAVGVGGSDVVLFDGDDPWPLPLLVGDRPLLDGFL